MMLLVVGLWSTSLAVEGGTLSHDIPSHKSFRVLLLIAVGWNGCWLFHLENEYNELTNLTSKASLERHSTYFCSGAIRVHDTAAHIQGLCWDSLHTVLYLIASVFCSKTCQACRDVESNRTSTLCAYLQLEQPYVQVTARQAY